MLNVGRDTGVARLRAMSMAICMMKHTAPSSCSCTTLYNITSCRFHVKGVRTNELYIKRGHVLIAGCR